MAFIKTEKQIAACNVLNSNTHSLIFGGSRSGKTTIITRNIFLRALKTPSRHLLCRFRFNHAKMSLWHDTIPKVLALAFPGVYAEYNNSDFYITLETAKGGESTIWLGGVDDKERVEKILGNEYSSIYANECSQISYESINMLRTRLAENSGLPLRFYYDLNPCGKGHWSYKEFVEKVSPVTKLPHLLKTGYSVINPYDNSSNLPAEYLHILENLPPREKQRFLEGNYLSDVEGALWTMDLIDKSRIVEIGTIKKTVVAIDPSVSDSKDSDEVGIVVASIDEAPTIDESRCVVHEDLSGKMSTIKWAEKAVAAYHYWDANEIVAEANNGGDLVRDVIHAVDPTIKVVLVHASKGKYARAEPVSALYEKGRIKHEKVLPKLEEQMTEYVPLTAKKSPDRLDALVWAVTHLLLRKTERSVRVSVV